MEKKGGGEEDGNAEEGQGKGRRTVAAEERGDRHDGSADDCDGDSSDLDWDLLEQELRNSVARRMRGEEVEVTDSDAELFGAAWEQITLDLSVEEIEGADDAEVGSQPKHTPRTAEEASTSWLVSAEEWEELASELEQQTSEICTVIEDTFGVRITPFAPVDEANKMRVGDAPVEFDSAPPATGEEESASVKDDPADEYIAVDVIVLSPQRPGQAEQESAPTPQPNESNELPSEVPSSSHNQSGKQKKKKKKKRKKKSAKHETDSLQACEQRAESHREEVTEEDLDRSLEKYLRVAPDPYEVEVISPTGGLHSASDGDDADGVANKGSKQAGTGYPHEGERFSDTPSADTGERPREAEKPGHQIDELREKHKRSEAPAEKGFQKDDISALRRNLQASRDELKELKDHFAQQSAAMAQEMTTLVTALMLKASPNQAKQQEAEKKEGGENTFSNVEKDGNISGDKDEISINNDDDDVHAASDVTHAKDQTPHPQDGGHSSSLASALPAEIITAPVSSSVAEGVAAVTISRATFDKLKKIEADFAKARREEAAKIDVWRLRAEEKDAQLNTLSQARAVEVAELRADMEGLECRLGEEKRVNESLQLEIDAMKPLSDRCDAAEALALAMKEEKEKLLGAMAKVERENANHTSVVSVYRSELEEHKAKAQRLEDEVETLRKRAEEGEIAHINAKKKVDEVVAINDDMLRTIRSKDEEAKIEQQKYAKQVKLLEKQCLASAAPLQEKVLQLTARHEEARTENESLAAALASAREANRKLQHELSARKADEAEISAQNRQQEHRIQELRQALGRVQTTAQEEVDALRSSVKAADEQIAEMTQQVQQDRGTIQALEAKLAEAEAQNKDLERALQSSKTDLQDLLREEDAILSSGPTEFDEHGDRGSWHRAENEDTNTATFESREKKRSELVSLRIKSRLHDSVVSRYEAKVDDLSSRCKALKEELQSVYAEQTRSKPDPLEMKRLHNRAAVAENMNRLLEDENSQLQKRLAEAGRVRAKAESEAMAFRDELDEAKEEVANLKAILERHDKPATQATDLYGLSFEPFDPFQQLSKQDTSQPANQSKSSSDAFSLFELPPALQQSATVSSHAYQYAANTHSLQQQLHGSSMSPMLFQGQSDVDLLRDLRLTEQKCKGYERQIEQLLTRIKHMEQAASDPLRSVTGGSDVISMVTHARLMDMAERRAVDAERRAKELENEIILLNNKLETANMLVKASSARSVQESIRSNYASNAGTDEDATSLKKRLPQESGEGASSAKPSSLSSRVAAVLGTPAVLDIRPSSSTPSALPSSNRSREADEKQHQQPKSTRSRSPVVAPKPLPSRDSARDQTSPSPSHLSLLSSGVDAHSAPTSPSRSRTSSLVSALERTQSDSDREGEASSSQTSPHGSRVKPTGQKSPGIRRRMQFLEESHRQDQRSTATTSPALSPQRPGRLKSSLINAIAASTLQPLTPQQLRVKMNEAKNQGKGERGSSSINGRAVDEHWSQTRASRAWSDDDSDSDWSASDGDDNDGSGDEKGGQEERSPSNVPEGRHQGAHRPPPPPTSTFAPASVAMKPLMKDFERPTVAGKKRKPTRRRMRDVAPADLYSEGAQTQSPDTCPDPSPSMSRVAGADIRLPPSQVTPRSEGGVREQQHDPRSNADSSISNTPADKNQLSVAIDVEEEEDGEETGRELVGRPTTDMVEGRPADTKRKQPPPVAAKKPKPSKKPRPPVAARK